MKSRVVTYCNSTDLNTCRFFGRQTKHAEIRDKIIIAFHLSHNLSMQSLVCFSRGMAWISDNSGSPICQNSYRHDLLLIRITSTNEHWLQARLGVLTLRERVNKYSEWVQNMQQTGGWGGGGGTVRNKAGGGGTVRNKAYPKENVYYWSYMLSQNKSTMLLAIECFSLYTLL